MLFARIETTALFQFGIRSFLIPAAFAKNCGAAFRKMDACLRNNRPFSFSEKETKTWGVILPPHSERTVNNVAIYHFEAKVITRGVGRSVVAAAAYMSCSEIFISIFIAPLLETAPRSCEAVSKKLGLGVIFIIPPGVLRLNW